MRQFSLKREDHWEHGLYLVFSSTGDLRMTRGAPRLESNERCMALNLKVPHSLFRVPELRGTITLSEAGTEPPAVDITVAEQALSEALGAKVALTIQGEQL